MKQGESSSTDQPRVGVLVSTFNHEDFISECLESIFDQTYRNLVVHVVDDKSEDNTWAILLELGKKFGDNLKLYRSHHRQGNAGKSILANLPDLRDCVYWAYLDGDDYWTNIDKVHLQVRQLEEDGGVVGVATKTTIIDPTGKVGEIFPDVDVWNKYDLALNSHKTRHYCHISSILWRNTFSNNLIPWPPRYTSEITRRGFSGEVVLSYLMLDEPRSKMVFLDIPASVYRFSGRGMWTSLLPEERLKANKVLGNQLRTGIGLRNRIEIGFLRMLRQIDVCNRFRWRALNK